MITLPQQKVWAQIADRESFDPVAFGSILASLGIDITSNPGRILLGPRMLVNTSQDDLADMKGVPVGFWLCGGKLHTIAGDSSGGAAFTNADVLANSAFTKDTDTDAPTTITSQFSDGTFSNNALYVTGPTVVGGLFAGVWKKVGSLDWTKFSTSASSSYPMMLFPFAGRTYMTTDQSKVISWDSSDTISYSGANTIILNNINGDFSNVITRPLVGSDRVWLLCLNTTGARGHIYEWDGAATTHSRKHNLHSAGALSGCIYHDVPYIIDANANIQYWNGSTFKTVASFFRKKKKVLYNNISLSNDRFVHPNSMNVVDEKILITIDNRNYDSTYSIEETIPAGVYEFDPNNPVKGIVCKQVFGLSKASGTVKDNGQIRVAGVGGLSELNIPSTDSSKNGSFLVGAKVYKDHSSTMNAIFYDDINDTEIKAGSFITLKFDSTGAKDFINKLKILHSKTTETTHKIVAKYRREEVEPVEATITWVNSTSFTVANSAIDLTTYFTEGDSRGAEVEVIQGTGSNICSHITGATLVAGTWTVTVDQTYSNVTGSSKARFQKWIWLSEANSDLPDSVLTATPEGNSTWIQFKLWLQWIGRKEIERMIIDEDIVLPSKLKS
jgi:hypothetical protein